MKKILAIVLMLMMALSLMACESKTIEDSTLQVNSPIVNDILIDNLSTQVSNETSNATNSTYNDGTVTIAIDNNDNIVFLGNSTVDWEIEGYDNGVLVMQHESSIVVYPQVIDTELTISILGSNNVKYFITFIKHSDNTSNINVERLELDETNPMCGIYYICNWL